MDLHKISIFLEVMRQRSLVKAANTLRLDASVVSRAIAALESDLGTRLFVRTTRKLSPTEAGRDFYAHVEPLVEELDRARAIVRDRGSKPKGILRITSPVSFGLLILNPILTRFQNEFPEIEVEVLISDAVLDLVELRIDVAIRFGHLQDTSFVANKLADLDYVVCASPSYLKRSPPLRRPSDLQNHRCLPFLIQRFDSSWQFRARRTAEVERVAVRSRLRISSALAIKDAALAHEGVALLPEILVRSELEAGSLVRSLASYEATATEFGAKIWLLHPSRDYVPGKTKVFIDFMKAAMREQAKSGKGA